MTQIKLEDLIRQSADQAQFDFDEDHMAQAMEMIREKKRRRGAIWWFLPLLLLPVVGLWWWMSDAEITNSNQASQSTIALEKDPENQMDQIGIEAVTEQVSTDESILNDDSDSRKVLLDKKENSNQTVSNKENRASSGSRINDSERGRNAQAEKILAQKEVLDSEITNGEFTTAENTNASEQALITLVIPRRSWETPILSEKMNFSPWSIPAEELDETPVMRKIPRPMELTGFLDLQYQPGNFVATQRASLGLKLNQKINRHSHVGLEVGAVMSWGFGDDYLIQQVDDYGVEVMTRFYKVQPQWMVNGRASLLYGVQIRRFGVEVGPSLAFLPTAFGSISEVMADDGRFVDVQDIGDGILSSDNSQPVVFGGQMDAWYQTTPRTKLGITLQYDRNAFFNKDDIRSSRQDLIYVGMKYQWKF